MINRLNHIKKKLDFKQNILLLFLFFQILSFEMCQIYNVGKKSLLFFVISVILILYYAVEKIVKMKKNKYKNFDKNIFIFIIFEFLIIFFLIMNIGNIRDTFILKNCIFIIFAYFLIFCTQIIYILKVLFYRYKSIHFDWCSNGIILIVAFCITFFLNVECFNAWPRWDSYSYYNAVQSLSINNLFLGGRSGLIICGHISNIYALFSLISASLLDMSLLNALIFSNFVLMFVDIVLFYHIIRKIIPNKHILYYILCAVMLSVSPYLLGTSNVLNTEKLLLTGVLLFLYGYLYSNRIVLLLATFILCNTKETGVVTVAFMVGIELLIDIYKTLKYKVKIHYLYYITVFLTGVLWLFHYQQIDWSESIKSDVQVTYPLLDGGNFNSFDFSTLHIVDTLKGGLLTNFSWIFVLLIVCAILKLGVLIFTRHITFREIRCKGEKIAIISAGFLGFELILCSFITYHFFRYYTAGIAFIYILGIVSLEFLIRNIKHKDTMSNICIGIISLLLLLQSYKTIDPWMLRNMSILNTGNERLAALDIHMRNFYDPAFMDCVNYNRQIMYYDIALDKALSDIKPTNTTKVLVSGEYAPKEGLGSLFTIYGYGYSYVDFPNYVKFNNLTGKRFLSEIDGEDTFDLGYITSIDGLELYEDYQRLFYIQMPWQDDTLIKIKDQEDIQISLYNTVEYKGWILNVYEIKM